MYEPTRIQVCKAVAERVREAGDVVDATAIIMQLYDEAKDIGYKLGRKDEEHAHYHGRGVRI
jgi:hypothetical protein